MQIEQWKTLWEYPYPWKLRTEPEWFYISHLEHELKEAYEDRDTWRSEYLKLFEKYNSLLQSYAK